MLTYARFLTPLLFAAAALAEGVSGSGAVSIQNSSPVTQSFDSLSTGSGPYSTLPAGWYVREAGTGGAADGLYIGGTGSNNAGNAYSFGASGSTERALGSLTSGTVSPIQYGAKFTNDTGAAITSLAVSYVLEQWRTGGSTTGTDSLTFSYSLDATSLSAGTFTSVPALSITAPISGCTTSNGNTAACQRALSATITGLAIPAGATFWIRWQDSDVAGNDDGFAVDDFSLTATTAGATPTNPMATASANPSTVEPAQAFVISGTIVPGTLPTSQSYTVVCDLSPIGRPSVQNLSVTGTAFTLSTDAAAETAAGAYVIGCTVRDDQSRTGTFNVPVTIIAPLSCGAASTLISAVQGSAVASTLAGQSVDIEGIVTASYQSASTQLGGYYLQSPAGSEDANPATSEGVFVYANGAGPAVNPGDRVRVRGRVAEYTSSGSSLTEIQLSQATVCSVGNTLPTPVNISLPVASTAALERYEGMLVQFNQQLVVTGTYNLGTFGQIDLAPSVLFQPTQATGNATSWAAAADLNARSRIALDDASTLANASILLPTLYPAGGLTASNTLRVGALVNNVNGQVAPLTGILDDRFGSYRLQPVGAITFNNSPNPRPDTLAASNAVGGRVRAVSANVLNYFTTLGKRGAATASEFANQRAKIAAQLSRLNADIYGLSEVQNFENGNTSGVTYTNVALQSLVDALRTASGRNYQFIDTINAANLVSGNVTDNGTDAIRNVIVYDPARVTPVGKAALYYQNDQNRPSLAQTFKPASGNGTSSQTFTVVVNHFRSKSTGCGAGDDTYQGGCNSMRLSMANNVRNWLSTNPTADPSANRKLLLVGDMNAYFGEDPIQALIGAGGYTNLINLLLGPNASSYNFGSQAGYLDHALANANLLPLVKNVAEIHNNADEPVALEALDSGTKPAAAVSAWFAADEFAASDHDPIVIGFNPLPGDFNDDGIVDLADRNIIVAAYGKPASAVDRRLDLDGDGVIAPNDYRLWVNLYRAYTALGNQ